MCFVCSQRWDIHYGSCRSLAGLCDPPALRPLLPGTLLLYLTLYQLWCKRLPFTEILNIIVAFHSRWVYTFSEELALGRWGCNLIFLFLPKWGYDTALSTFTLNRRSSNIFSILSTVGTVWAIHSRELPTAMFKICCCPLSRLLFLH